MPLSGNGGIVGLTEDEDKFRRWQICSPEAAKHVSEFEDITVLKGNEHSEFHHHEDSKAFQERFANHVALLATKFNQLGNPFGPDESKELVQLGTKEVMTDNVVSTVRNIEEIGRKQHAEFRETRIFHKIINLDDPIKKNKLPTFKASNTKGRSAKTESQELKIRVRLFLQMYISTQIRGGNMEEFFSHETLQYPPALARSGRIRSGNKSDLVKCIQPLSYTETVSNQPKVPAVVLEGSVLVNLANPNKNQSFKDHATHVFYPQIRKQMNEYSAQRVDIVFDTYKDQSLKGSTRVKRRKGIRRKVLDKSVAPTNWRSFLRLDQNKIELFRYLSTTIIQHGNRGDVIMIYAYDDTCISGSNELDLSNLTPCNHEEANARVFLHLKDMTKQGHRKMVIRTVDTDVLVLAVSVYKQLQEEMEELWVDFGTRKNRKFFPIHKTLENIGECKARALPFFHAFTGCDQVSFLPHAPKSAA